MTLPFHLSNTCGESQMRIEKCIISNAVSRLQRRPVGDAGKRWLAPTHHRAQRSGARAHPIYTWLIGCASVKKNFIYFQREAGV